MSAVTARQEPRDLRAFRHTEYLPCSFVWHPIVLVNPSALKRGSEAVGWAVSVR
jgi:hypothetical protein